MLGYLEIYCPAMATRHQGPGHSLTDVLDAPWRLTLDKTYEGVIRFDATDVWMEGMDPNKLKKIPNPLHWMVRPTIARTRPGDEKPWIISNLPEEPCDLQITSLHIKDWKMLVRSITAATLITLPDGRIGEGVITYPEVIADCYAKGVWMVRAVTASGNLDFTQQ